MCENTNNPESGCGSIFSLKEVISQDSRLDIQDTNELQSVQSLRHRLFDSHGRGIPDCCCENCIKDGFRTISTSVSDIGKFLIVQLPIFRYDPMNNRIRELIPNLRITWKKVTLSEKLNIHGIIWYQ